MTPVRSGASLHLVSRLRWLAAIFFALVAVLVPSRARASMTPASETRIGDFHLPHPALLGVITVQTTEKHRTISLFVYDRASDRCFRWKGRPFDEVTGLYDMRARWWSPQLGAFVVIDEYGYHDPNSTLWGWGNQNPIRWNDPTGKCPACVGAAIGFVGGAALGGIYYAFTAPTNLSWGQFAEGALASAGEGAAAGAAAGTLGVVGGTLSAGGTLGEAFGLSPLGTALLSSAEIAALRPTGEQRDLINQLFQTGEDDAGLAVETLKNYLRLAQNALNDPNKATPQAIAEQTRRIKLIEQVLKSRGCQ